MERWRSGMPILSTLLQIGNAPKGCTSKHFASGLELLEFSDWLGVYT